MENKKVKIKDVVKLINGFPFKPTDRSDFGMNIIRIQNLNNHIAIYNRTDKKIDKKYIVKKGDILISWSASLGVYAWENDEAYLNQHIFKVEFISKVILKDYFKYVIELAIEELTYKMHGVGIKHLKKGQLDDYEFNLPHIDKQQEIVNRLNNLNEIRKKRKKTIELIDEYNKSLFLEMFISNSNSKRWKTQIISKIIKSANYGTSKKPNDDNVGIGVLRMNNITFKGDIDLRHLKNVEIDNKEIEKLLLERRDILFNRTNSRELIGKTAVWDIDESFVYAGYLIRLKLDEEQVNPYYFSAFLNSSIGKKLLYAKAQPSGNMVNFSLSLLKKQKIVIPPITLQNEFEFEFKNNKNIKLVLIKSLDLLEEYFQSLLYNSFNKNDVQEDEIDKIMNDELEVETIIQDIKTSDYESLTQYNISKDLLFKILERTETKNEIEKEPLKFNKGIVQIYTQNKIEIKTNREYKLDSK